MEHVATAPAAGFTIGVEEEYQLVDAATGALRSHASRVRREDWTGELLAELQETTVEIGTPICASVADAAEHLRRLRFQASTVASTHGLAIVAAGLHPFSGWEGHARPAVERYRPSRRGTAALPATSTSSACTSTSACPTAWTGSPS
jgi:glutamate---cysteine ligase / carboxylate-amine ligase